MKKLYIFFIFFIPTNLCYGQTIGYYPFPDSNSIWVGTDHWFDGINCYIYDDYNLFINGDTTIGEYTYKKLYKNGFIYSNCPPPGYYYYGQYAGAFRQEIISKKVFINYNGPDLLAYDFNISLGDTLPVTHLIGPNHYVDLIDSILIGESYRKRYWVSNQYSYNYIALIEGIGSTNGAFADFSDNWGEAGSNLWCVFYNDELIWQFDTTGYGCNLISSVNVQIPKNEITISPNPFHSFTKISIPENYTDLTLSMYNSFGQKVKEISKIQNKAIIIERGNLERGLYFIQITKGCNHIMTNKILIQD